MQPVQERRREARGRPVVQGRARRREAQAPVVQAVLELALAHVIYCWLICYRLGGSQIVKIHTLQGRIHPWIPRRPAVICELLTLSNRTVDPISREGGLPRGVPV